MGWRLHGVYWYACPHCGGPIGDDRLYQRLPCTRCLPEERLRELRRKGVLREKPDGTYDPRAVAEFLPGDSEYKRLARLLQEVKEAEALFEKAMGSRFWSVQRMWLKRVLRGKSFAAIAPTGIGKTTFGVFAAVYLAATRSYKSYIIVPTTPLVEQVEERAERIASVMPRPVRILAIHSRLSVRERRSRLKAYQECDFDVLITTSSFMLRRLDEILAVLEGKCGQRFYMIFVDDVDSVLKSGRSVDAILRLAGFTEKDIEKGWELLRLRREVARLAERGRKLGEQEKARLVELVERMRRLEKELEEKRRCICGECPRRECTSMLVVSSATGRPRGSRVRLFQALLGFQAGSRPELYRNIVDAYVEPSDGIEEEVVKLVKRLGDGGLVYVPVDKGAAYAEQLAELLRSRGVKAEAFTAKNPHAIERFRRGETQVLVGVAIYYGVMVRGLDLPERIRYAVFAGVPRHRFSARFEDPHPTNILRALSLLVEYAPRDIAEEAERLYARLRRLTRRLSTGALRVIAEELTRGEPRSEAARLFNQALEFVRKALSRPDVWEALEKAEDIAIVREDDKAYILMPDVATYIQASGRTSRLYAGGITKGLSVIVVDDRRLLEGLRRRLRWYIGEADIKPLSEINLDEVLREIDRDRERVKAILEGRVPPEQLELVKTALLIVESPNKARTIASFFGRPSIREISGIRAYEVSTGDYVLTIVASGGHIYDLVKTYYPTLETPSDWLTGRLKEHVSTFPWSEGRVVNKHGIVSLSTRRVTPRYLPVYSPLLRCPDCGFQSAVNPEPDREVDRIVESVERGLGRVPERLFDERGLPLYCPRCGSPNVRTSLPIVEALRELASEVDVVMIGTDPDTEGEKIGWDVAALVAPFAEKLVRVEFHEVTRKAILEAIRSPRLFRRTLVEAQIVRRSEDRWIGFTLSPVLWTDFWLNYYCRRMREALARRGKRSHRLLERLEKLCSGLNYNLSAGRVQTPVLAWIVDRWARYEAEEKACRRLEEGCGRAIVTLEDGARITLETGIGFARKAREKGYVDVIEEKREVVEESPLPPYTTDAMLADAWDKLRIPAPVAMQLAQDLFEMGFITYHRTDSTRVSDAGIAVAREYIRQVWGEEGLRKLFRPRRWEPKHLIGVEAAHEAIRPTRPIDAGTLRRLVEEGIVETPRPLTRRHLALYELIFRRFVASQMAPARIEVQVLKARVDGEEAEARRRARVVEPGFLLVYKPWEVEGEAKPGRYRVVSVRGRPSTWPLTHAEVVKLMKEEKIGRPSTYAKIIDTLHQRKYVRTLPRVGWLKPTPRGRLVKRYLLEGLAERLAEIAANYSSGVDAGAIAERVKRMISVERTRELLEKMDEVEDGRIYYEDLLDDVREEIESIEAYLQALIRETIEGLGRRGP